MTRKQRNVMLAVEKGETVECTHSRMMIDSLVAVGWLRRRDPAPGEFPLTHVYITPSGEQRLKEAFK